MARTQANINGSHSAIMGDGFLDSYNTLHDAAMDGVSCTVCHQIIDRGLGQDATFSGQFAIDHRTESPDRVIYGPYIDPVAEMMTSFVGFTPVYGEHLSRSALCATCHTLFTPYVDADGEIQGTFPEQTPYLEWLISDFGSDGDQYTECQECHMPTIKDAVLIANRPISEDLPKRGPFSQHHFVGGNATMIKVLRDNAEELGVTAFDQALEATLDRVLDQLQSNTANLEIQSVGIDGDNLVLEIQILPLTGHKFPSGYPSRRVWLHVVIQDDEGSIVFESGAPATDGSIVGCDADTDAGLFEPHYDHITSSDQVQIYETIMVNTDNEVTYTLLRAAGYIKDNRLLPAGFSNENASNDIAVQGAAQDDPNFVGGSDHVTYAIALQDTTGSFKITVELFYQSLSFRTLQDIFSIDTPEVDQFEAVYAGIDKTPVAISIVHAQLP